MHLPIKIYDARHGQAVELEWVELEQGLPEAVVHTMSAFANDFHNLGGS